MRATLGQLLSRIAFGTAAAAVCAGAVAAQFPPANPPYQAGFPVTLNGAPVSTGSVNLGDLDGDGRPDVVVGTADGKVHAYTGFGTRLWVYSTGGMGIGGKPAIADVDGDGLNEVVVGSGSTVSTNLNTHGGLFVISNTGSLKCPFMTNDSDGNGLRDGVFSSPALADLDGNDGGRLEIAFGAWDRRVRVLHDNCNLAWEVNVFDTVWSSPAIGDVNGDGQLDVVIGVDSDDAEVASRPQGGELYAFNGATGAVLAGFPVPIDEVIQSSPGLANLSGDFRFEIAVGTGRCWSDPLCAPGKVHAGGEYLNAWSGTGAYLAGWPVAVPGTYAFASPALADVDNDGELEVVINTVDPDDQNAGRLHVLNADGSSVPGWPVRPTLPTGAPPPNDQVHFSTIASPIVADVTGDGNLEVILASNWDLVVFDKDGNQLSYDSLFLGPGDLELRTNGPLGSSAAVGDIDGDGDLEVVVGSYATGVTGAIYAWDFAAPASSRKPWPMFRRSPDNRAADDGLLFADGFEAGNTSAWSAPP